jgi:hypothetical protein
MWGDRDYFWQPLQFTRLLRNLKFHYSVNKIAPLFLSHMTPVHPLPPSFLKIYLNINFPPTPIYSKSGVPTWTLHAFLWPQMLDACVMHLSLFNIFILIRFGKCNLYNVPHYVFLTSWETRLIWCRNCLIGMISRLRAEQPRSTWFELLTTRNYIFCCVLMWLKLLQ